MVVDCFIGLYLVLVAVGEVIILLSWVFGKVLVDGGELWLIGSSLLDDLGLFWFPWSIGVWFSRSLPSRPGLRFFLLFLLGAFVSLEFPVRRHSLSRLCVAQCRVRTLRGVLV